ncbi:aldehyde dehydrogenase family protein [Natrinema soli]|uniref:Aldehyde dehydrogenase family protein n=1 Tax=Natrinema soli TaxID=1930624 RepID=A0ABD5SSQ5_9EURY
MAATCNKNFGPIAPVIPFSDIDKAVESHNAVEYGLSGSIHAGDVSAGDGSLIASRPTWSRQDRPGNDEAHVSFSGTDASSVGGYNNGLP